MSVFSGVCYQFNGNGSHHVEEAGLTNGLEFRLNVRPREYYVGYFAHATGMSVSFLLIRLNLYTTMHHFGIPGHNQSLKA